MQEFFLKKSDKASPQQATKATGVATIKEVQVTQHDQVWNFKQSTTKAEIIATLHFAAENIAFSSSENLGKCYQMQSPDSVIARNGTIGPIKMSYMVSYGLGPYFIEMNAREIVQVPSYLTLHFDETVSAQTKRQIDLPLCNWSETNNEVRVMYLTSAISGHAKAVNVV